MSLARLRTAAALGFLAGALALLIALPTPTAGADKPAKDRKPAPANPTEDVFGYTAAFDEELKKIGQISPVEFAKLFPTGARYQNKLSWDPTTAKFFDDFNTDPSKSKRGWGYDFRLNAEELAAFKKNGFMVSERMGAASFAEQYYRIFTRDLPVFITSDALLHAWHRSYDAMLEEL